MFERYTEKARRVIFFGRYEASQLGSPYIETEHLLLGIFREEKTLVHHFIKSEAVRKEIHEEIEKYADESKKGASSVDLPLSNESKRVLAYAAEEAERLGHKHIGTEHLFLGLLREEKGFAAELLQQHGVRLSTAREIIMKMPAESQAPAGRLTQSTSREVTFAEFGVDLTDAALNGKLPPLIGRNHELDTVIRILGRVTKANPVLIGEPGVGKKSIVNGLAHRISEADVPLHSQDKRVVTLDLAAIASGVKSHTRFEENLESILYSLQASNLVLFVDGLHALAQTQRFPGIINVLKPALRNGDIHCISTAVPAEYDKTLEAAPWLERYFTPVQVRPLGEAEALTVLRGIKESFEKFHGVTYTDEALQYAVFHSNSYFRNQHLPEKAIDLIDEAGALVQFSQEPLPDEVLEARKRVKFIQDRHEAALNNHEFEKARFYADELKKARHELEVLRNKYKTGDEAFMMVTRDHIEKIVAERTGVSIELLRKSRIPE